MTKETLSLPEFNTWLENLRDTRDIEEIVELAGVDEYGLVEMLKYDLFRIYSEEAGVIIPAEMEEDYEEYYET